MLSIILLGHYEGSKWLPSHDTWVTKATVPLADCFTKLVIYGEPIKLFAGLFWKELKAFIL